MHVEAAPCIDQKELGPILLVMIRRI